MEKSTIGLHWKNPSDAQWDKTQCIYDRNIFLINLFGKVHVKNLEKSCLNISEFMLEHSQWRFRPRRSTTHKF